MNKLNFDLEAMAEQALRVQQRGELLDLTARIYAARIGSSGAGDVSAEDAVTEARLLIMAVDGSIEADGLPGEEEWEEEEEEEEEEDDWEACEETDGCAMRDGHNGACWDPKSSMIVAKRPVVLRDYTSPDEELSW